MHDPSYFLHYDTHTEKVEEKKTIVNMPSPNSYIEHITTIDANIETVWNVLIDIEDWEWNKWTRLEVVDGNTPPEEGDQGKLKASYEGNDEWKTFDFTFGKVSSQEYALEWYGEVGPSGCLFSGYHSMRLEKIDGNKTKLIHSEKFKGILPLLGLGLPYQTIERNYLLMNESLKSFVENSN